jgi:tetratricopeptide (TPR) repeat protein
MAGLALSGLLGLWGCTSGPSARERLLAGQDAYKSGEVLTAYRLLKPLAADGGREVQALMAEVARAAEYLVELWLEKADHFLSQGDLVRSAAYYQDLLQLLPDADGLRRTVEQRASPVLGRLQQLRETSDALVAQARQEFSAGRYDEARQKLEEARWQVLESSLEFPVEHERLLEECERRLPGEVEELTQAGEQPEIAAGAGHLGASKTAASRPKRTRRPAVRPRPPIKRQPAPVASGSSNPQPEPVAAVEPMEPRVRALFEEGQQAARRGDTAVAVVAFRKLLRLLPTHQGAKKALAELEPARAKLVSEWMTKASQLFAQERLEEAAPYYEKILTIDPDNIRAREGRQMYLRLQELKAKQK